MPAGSEALHLHQTKGIVPRLSGELTKLIK